MNTSEGMMIMLSKVIVAAAMLAGLMVSGAAADPNNGIRFGRDCGVWWNVPCTGSSGFYDWREEELGFRVGCAEARDIVRDRGYRNVRVFSCGVRVHGFTGLRRGHRFLIKVDGYNGNIWSIRRID
jgi:hypothetical protein